MCLNVNGEIEYCSARSTLNQETAVNTEHVINVVKLGIYELFNNLKKKTKNLIQQRAFLTWGLINNKCKSN